MLPSKRAGLCGWTVLDDKMDEWKRRRQTWFMQGKEGKPYKANSLYQFLRRLGFFPTEVSSAACLALAIELEHFATESSPFALPSDCWNGGRLGC